MKVCYVHEFIILDHKTENDTPNVGNALLIREPLYHSIEFHRLQQISQNTTYSGNKQKKLSV